MAAPSASVVYVVSASEDDSQGAISIAVAIEEAGAYTLLVSHTAEEVPVVLVSPSGEALEPLFVEEGGHEGHEEEEDHEEEEGHEEDTESATAKQWGTALAASFILSLTRWGHVGWWKGKGEGGK